MDRDKFTVNDIEVLIESFGPVTRIRLGRKQLGRVRLWANVYWLDGLLIDSGSERLAPALLAALDKRGLHVQQLVNTHSHEDHVGGNAALAQRFGVTGKIHPLGVGTVERPPTTLPFYRGATWGLPQPANVEPLDVNAPITTDRYRFDIIHTPGHAVDHIVLFEREHGWLFAGDLFLSSRVQMVMHDEQPLTLLDSMKRAAALPVTKLFCGHAWAVPDSTAPLKDKITYWERIQHEAKALTAKGLSTQRIARKLLGKTNMLELISNGEYHRRHLITGLLADAPEPS